MNPYAGYLGDRDPLQVIAATAGELQRMAALLGPKRMEESPAPGKWSARQIVCHLADCEIAFAFRLRQALAEEHHVIQPFDQDGWAKNYDAYSTQEALVTFSTLRQWNRTLIASLDAEDFSKPVTHPERGSMTFRTVVQTMGGHDINHLRQIEALAAKAA